MGIPQSPTSSHLYPQAIQLKLYQAFIFSIPILFSIILFLLFYLFYLKRRATTLSSSAQVLPRSSGQATSYLSTVCQVGLKKEIKEKLPIVLFDEELRTKDSQCCVCLGDFVMNEELLQIPSCKHVFHIDCIHHWLHSNSTCPLCRSFVIPVTKLTDPPGSGGPALPQQDNTISNHHRQNVYPQQQPDEQQQEVGAGSTGSRGYLTIPIEGSSQANTCSVDLTNSPEPTISVGNGRSSSDHEPVVLHIQTHGT